MSIVRIYENDGRTLLKEFETDDLVPPFNLKVVKFIRPGFTRSGWNQIPDRAGNVQPLELVDDD